MKNFIKVTLVMLFFFVCASVIFCCRGLVFQARAESLEPCGDSIEYEFNYCGKKFNFSSNSYNANIGNEERAKRIGEFFNVVKFCPNKIDAVFYCFPEMREIVKTLQHKLSHEARQGEVYVKRNECALSFKPGEPGIFLDLSALAEGFERELGKGLAGETGATKSVYISDKKLPKKIKNKIKIELKTKKQDIGGDPERYIKERSCFSTSFSSSSEERKHNIALALSKFDGLTLEVGEVLSFNAVTGGRTQSNGYLPAKIISNGTFIEGTGGGVCQVSTTIYNACILAGMEVLQVNSHSLPVSYVEPSFDAMVNSGSSDLVVKNNTGSKIIITTSSKNNICKVKIFGEKNKYKIERVSKKTETIKAEPTPKIEDYKNYPNLSLERGQEKQISFAKDGFVSSGYLNYYNNRGELVKTEKIRTNRYNPTRTIIVKREE